MGDHGELVREMSELEKLPTAERLKMAKRRRRDQLKRFSDYDKKQDKMERKKVKTLSGSKGRKSGGVALAVNGATRRNRRIRFRTDIMFLEAAARNDIAEVRSLLKEGVNPDVANTDGLTALHQSCIDDSLEMCILLLDHGANPNSRDSELWTPFHAAATCGHLRICKVLVEREAELLAVNADGNMPYDICEAEATLEYIETEMASRGVTQQLIDDTRLSNERVIMEELHAAGREGDGGEGDGVQAVLEYRDSVGATMLHLAAGNGYEELGDYLLQAGAAVDAADDDGWTPVHAAACWGHLEILDMLAKFGANLDVTTNSGETILDLCEDPEMKLQVEDIRREAKTKRQVKMRDEVRRRSSANLRSSSVRRHSMREKRKLSQKDARDEAKYRITINTEDDDKDIPVTNIDDIDVQVPASNVSHNNHHVTTINVETPDGQLQSPTTANGQPTGADLTMSRPRSPKPSGRHEPRRPERTATKHPRGAHNAVGDSDDDGDVDGTEATKGDGQVLVRDARNSEKRSSTTIDLGGGDSEGGPTPMPAPRPPSRPIGGNANASKEDEMVSLSSHDLKKQQGPESIMMTSLPRQANGNNGSIGDGSKSSSLERGQGYPSMSHSDQPKKLYSAPNEIIGGKDEKGCCTIL